MKRKYSGTRGFSQLEILVALIVLTVGILAVMASLMYSSRMVRTGKDHARATELAQRCLELVKTRNLVHWERPLTAADFDCAGNPAVPANGYPTCSGTQDAPGTWHAMDNPPFATDFPPAEVGKFRRNIRVRRVSTEPADYRYSLVEITVTIGWPGPDDPTVLRKLLLHGVFTQP